MKVALLALILSAPLFASAQNVKVLDQKNGFRDLTFGADTSALVGRIRQPAKNPATRIYSRSTDELKIGGAELVDIYYFFYKNQLCDILIHTKGLSNSRALLNALQANFGKAEQHNQFMQDYDWSGKKVMMNYNENSISGDASVFISSRIITKQQRADDAAAAKEAKGDL